MNGLEQIKAINDHAHEVYQEKLRRQRGQKPASEVGKILRRASGSRAPKVAPVTTVYAQGRQVALR